MRTASLSLSLRVLHWSQQKVSGLNAMDNTPMYKMPLISVFGVWGLGFWGWGSIFYNGVSGVGVLSRDP